MTETGHFYYSDSKIDYGIVRKQAKNKTTADTLITKNPRKVVIKVHPDLRVIATAPIDATDEMIHDTIMKRARWIWQSLQDFAKQKDHVLPKRYVSGETQFYLECRYVLKVLNNAENGSSVILSHGKLNVILRTSSTKLDADNRVIQDKRLLDNWYQGKARLIFTERLEILLPKVSWV